MDVAVLYDGVVRGVRIEGASGFTATLWLPLVIIGGVVKNLRLQH